MQCRLVDAAAVSRRVPRTIAALALSASVAGPLLATADEIRLSGLPATLQRGASGTMSIVYVRDLAGTPLGVDQAAGSKIQSLSVKLAYSPSSAFSSFTLSRTGVLAGLTAKPGETSPVGLGTASYFGAFAESSDPVPFTLDAAAPGDLVLQASYTVSPTAPPGPVTFTFDASFTLLANEAALIDETFADGGLALVGGSLEIVAQDLYAQPLSSSSIRLSWSDPNQAETGFRIERSPDGSSWSTLATVGPDATTYTDTSCSPATLYFYRLVMLVPADSQISHQAFATTFPTSAAKVCVQRLPGNDGTSARNPSAAWNDADEEWGVVWQAREDGLQDDIYFQSFDSTTLAPIGSPVNISQSDAVSEYPTIAWDGTGGLYGVVWYERLRREPGGVDEIQRRFALLGHTGAIERRSVVIPTPDPLFLPNSTKTALEWDGTHWGLFSTMISASPYPEIYYQRLSEDGSPVLSPVAVTGTPTNFDFDESAAWNSALGLYGVAWTRSNAGKFEVWFQRVEESTGGDPGGSSEVKLAEFVSGWGSLGVSVTANGSDGWAVAWSEVLSSSPQVFVRKVDASGAPVGSAEILLSDPGNPSIAMYDQFPSIHRRPAGEFVVFTTGYSYSGYSYEIVRLQADSSGALEGSSEVISPDDGNYSTAHQVAADGNRFLVVWNESGGATPEPLEVAGLLADDGDDAPPGPKVDLTSGHTGGTAFFAQSPGNHSVAPLGAGFVAIWTDPAHPNQIRGRSWDGSGATIATFTPLNSAPLAGRPGLVAVGDSFAVAFLDTSGQLVFARYAANGTPIVGETALAATSGAMPVLAFDGETYGILRRAGSIVRFLRVRPDGTLDGTETTLALGGWGPQVPELRWVGSGWAVLWHGGGILRFAFLSPAGAVLTPTTTVASNPGGPRPAQFSMQWNGSELGVAWSVGTSALDPPARDIYFTVLDFAGTKLFPPVVAASSDFFDGYPKLYWANGTFHLVHYSEQRSGVREIEVEPDGTVLPGERFWSNRDGEPAIAWNGVTLGMVWAQESLRALHFQTGACLDDPSPPPCPELSVASVDNLVRLSWPAVADAQSSIWRYQLLRDSDHLAELDAGTTTFDDAGYVTGTTHSYELLAMNGAYQESESCTPVAFSTTSGDANCDEAASILDILYLVNYFYADGDPPCGDGDANGDGLVNPTDAFYLINYFFSGGPPPAMPAAVTSRVAPRPPRSGGRGER